MDTFVRFVNMLLNDSIFLLDESLDKLVKIRGYQEEMASATWDDTPNVFLTKKTYNTPIHSFRTCKWKRETNYND